LSAALNESIGKFVLCLNASRLEEAYDDYLKLYNHHIPQRSLDAKTPILALKEWQQKRPELFVKRVYDQTGLDTPGCAPEGHAL